VPSRPGPAGLSDIFHSPKVDKSIKPSSTDNSIFKGKSEILRRELRDALRDNYVGSKMDRFERIKLEKEIFPSYQGLNISKSDFNLGVRKLERKMLSETDVAKKSEMRKQVNYLKRLKK